MVYGNRLISTPTINNTKLSSTYSTIIIKQIYVTAGVAVFSKNMEQKVENSEEVAVAEYQCPMKCEGEKTYTDKDTKCPVCGMGLKEVEHTNGHKNNDE